MLNVLFVMILKKNNPNPLHFMEVEGVEIRYQVFHILYFISFSLVCFYFKWQIIHAYCQKYSEACGVKNENLNFPRPSAPSSYQYLDSHPSKPFHLDLHE